MLGRNSQPDREGCINIAQNYLSRLGRRLGLGEVILEGDLIAVVNTNPWKQLPSDVPGYAAFVTNVASIERYSPVQLLDSAMQHAGTHPDKPKELHFNTFRTYYARVDGDGHSLYELAFEKPINDTLTRFDEERGIYRITSGALQDCIKRIFFGSDTLVKKGEEDERLADLYRAGRLCT